MKENDFKILQKNTYERLASNFDVMQSRENRNHINKIAAISEFLDIKDGETVLEVGIGTGIHAEYLFKLNKGSFSFYGVDY